MDIRALLQAIRPQQWVKNTLVFVPLVAGHALRDLEAVQASALAFLAFSSVASSIYLVNDVMDRGSDRNHPTKRTRPIAAGRLGAGPALAAAGALLALGLGGSALLLPLPFVGVLGLYGVATLAYSVWLKTKVMLDVVMLSLFYLARILAGGAATGIPISFWLLAFSMFFFFSLGVVKRHAELFTWAVSEVGERRRSESRRGYQRDDLSILGSLGVSSGFLSVLVLALYLNSEEVEVLYAQPWILWLLCPLLFYWIGRVWLITHRGEMVEDPVVFAVRDKVGRGIVVVGAVLLWLAR